MHTKILLLQTFNQLYFNMWPLLIQGQFKLCNVISGIKDLRIYIQIQIALSGILEIKGVDIKHKSEIKSDQHGILVSANSIGVYHDHFYIYHLFWEDKFEDSKSDRWKFEEKKLYIGQLRLKLQR